MDSPEDYKNNGSIFSNISKIVSEITGVQFGKRQKSLVETRIGKRIRDLGLETAENYWQYFLQNKSSETKKLVSLLTTHHTYFFREYSHFEFLKQSLPEIIKNLTMENKTTLKIWCAACSRGQEVYSLSMFLKHHLQQIAPHFDFQILGTDVDEESIALAKNGVYRWDDVNKSPAVYLEGNWISGTGDISEFVKANQSLRKHCQFQVLNLKEFSGELAGQNFDVIFCRNVFIYFDAHHTELAVNRMIQHIKSPGYFIVGLSENLLELKLPLNHIGQSIYCVQDKQQQTLSPVIILPSRELANNEPLPEVNYSSKSYFSNKILRVLTVDDSPTVLAMLKKILSPNHGFEVVATAKNGIEASQVLQNTEVDVITLDIHMPEQNGIQYLEKNFNDKHPPVVMVSSVQRDDSDFAIKSFDFGASDYVEKPTWDNLNIRSDEIRTKLFCAYQMKQEHVVSKHVIDHQLAHLNIVKNTDQKLRIIVLSLSEQKKLKEILKESRAPQPPTLVIIEGPHNLLPPLIEQIGVYLGKKVEEWHGEKTDLISNKIYFTSIETLSQVTSLLRKRSSVVLVLGGISKNTSDLILKWPYKSLMVEDIGFEVSKAHTQLVEAAALHVPYSSFAYDSDRLLNESIDDINEEVPIAS